MKRKSSSLFKLALMALTGLVGAMVMLSSLPDLRRYLRLRSM